MTPGDLLLQLDCLTSIPHRRVKQSPRWCDGGLTSCLLISWTEKVPFWWMSSVSDHSVLFLRLGGVGAAALLHGFWSPPGILPSPRREACRRERTSD